MTKEYKEDLKWFVEEMELKLDANAHKGTWKNDNIYDLYLMLRKELKELDHEFKALSDDDMGSLYRMIGECADIANFSMMIAERAYYLGGK